MKTLTKILSVTALIVLCVCLFTLTAFADLTIQKVNDGTTTQPNCATETDGFQPYIQLSNNAYYAGVHGKTAADVGSPVTDEVIATWGSPVELTDLIIRWSHTPSGSVSTPGADCQTRGTQYFTCKNCPKHFKDEACTIEGENDLGYGPHTIGTAHAAVKPDCVKNGNIDYWECGTPGCGKLCNSNGTITYTYDDVLLPANPALHEWGDWEILKPATNVSPGQKVRSCKKCTKQEYEEIPATGITDGEDLWYVIMTRDTWLRGEEPLTFESNLVAKLNAESGPNANYVGVRVGTDSLYENSWDTFDFWSWDGYVKLGEKVMQGLREGTYRLWIYDKRHPDVYTNSRPFYVVDVPTLEPYSTDKHVVNSSKSLRFIASEEIRPDSVQVGSRKLYDASDYFVSNDRKNITLSPDFLNARQTGTYTISALTKDGRTIKTNFYILSTAQASSSPRTGDESQIGLWAAFLLLSGAAIVVMVPKLRKHGAK